mgnify:CR=1 FL=1
MRVRPRAGPPGLHLVDTRGIGMIHRCLTSIGTVYRPGAAYAFASRGAAWTGVVRAFDMSTNKHKTKRTRALSVDNARDGLVTG